MKTKSVLVTGASSGIGYHAGVLLCGRGWNVFGSVRREEDATLIRKMGLLPVMMDMRDEESLQRGFSEVLERTEGRLEGLFLNAGVGFPGAIEDLPREVLQEQFETNVFGAATLARLAIPVMRYQAEGRIVICSSVLGFMGAPLRGAYVMSKFALEGMADVLRRETLGQGIRVSVVQPGPIRTQFRAHSAKNLERIETTDSFYRQAYRRMKERLARDDSRDRFTLYPIAVARDVAHAMESRRPRIRYRQTLPTHAALLMSRLLPDWLADMVMAGKV